MLTIKAVSLISSMSSANALLNGNSKAATIKLASQPAFRLSLWSILYFIFSSYLSSIPQEISFPRYIIRKREIHISRISLRFLGDRIINDGSSKPVRRSGSIRESDIPNCSELKWGRRFDCVYELSFLALLGLRNHLCITG